MTKTIDIILALRWEEGGCWQDYASNFNKKLATSKFRVFSDSTIPGLPKSISLVKARSFAAHHGGEVVEINDADPAYVGTRDRLGWDRDGYEAEEALRCSAKSGERQVGYIIRIPASSIVYGKLSGHIEGLEISDMAKNRYLYKGQWGTERFDETEHKRIQNGTSIYGKGLTFLRYIPRSTEGGL